ncbi:hypothetical protein H5410_061135 [Solanum commersonii]|uniref:Uncharacterized protein n=1 Tax=Solanum commersonii TaxID=4109 RepID=A0A9J5W7B4_SOLCO|nr:hypothetical protein H5410_061135 [Solanum commersonii]
MSALAPGQKDRLGRVMIEPDGPSWHPAKDAARDLKDCVRRLYTQAYHSWSEIPNSIRHAMFNNFKTMCTWESRYNLVIGTTFERKASARLSNWLKAFGIVVNVPVGCCLMFLNNWVSIGTQTSLRQYQIKPKWLEAVLKVARCTPEVQRWLEQLHERWKKENESDLDNNFHKYVAENLNSGTHKGRCYGLGSRNDVRRLQLGLEGIGSSRQAEALDATLAESEWKIVAEQESMSETI